MSFDPNREQDFSNLPKPIAKHPRNWSSRFIWIIPILALLVGIGLGVKVILERGSTITISFKSGDGIEAGKTFVKYKDVVIGVVKTIDLSEDHKEVIATVQIDRKATDFLREDTRFWIVKPRISASGVSGLGTLLSGAYIAADIGQATESRDRFVALDIPPILTQDTPGRKFVLHAPNLGSHDIGTPVYFRRLTVGEVVAYELDKDGKGVSIEVFIHAPYDKYVTSDSRFWNASGIDISVGAGGINVQTESLISVLAGGIAFESAPPNYDAITNTTEAIATQEVPMDTVFQLFSTKDLAMKNPDTRVERFVINFKQSVRGLSVGAPVEFRGVIIGEVLSVSTLIDPKDFTIVQPVVMNMYPERLRLRTQTNGQPYPPPKNEEERIKRYQGMIDRGLRAQLRSGNILTGQQYIALDFFPDSPKYVLDPKKNPLQLPTTPGGFDEVEKSFASIVKNTDKLIKKLDDETVPGINKLVASDSPLQMDLRDTLRELTKAASSLKKLTDMLDQQPQSIIFGKPSEESK